MCFLFRLRGGVIDMGCDLNYAGSYRGGQPLLGSILNI